MGKWSDLARATIESREGGDNRDNRDNSTKIRPIVSNVPIVPHELPAAIVLGLRKLEAMPVPRINNPKVWPDVVADALLLEAQGWAATAISLGWSPLQLWGVSPLADPYDDEHGLAVWTTARPVVLIDEATAIVRDGTRRHIYRRHDMTGARLLWDL